MIASSVPVIAHGTTAAVFEYWMGRTSLKLRVATLLCPNPNAQGVAKRLSDIPASSTIPVTALNRRPFQHEHNGCDRAIRALSMSHEAPSGEAWTPLALSRSSLAALPGIEGNRQICNARSCLDERSRALRELCRPQALLRKLSAAILSYGRSGRSRFPSWMPEPLPASRASRIRENIQRFPAGPGSGKGLPG
jgi:hypothetical protein